MSKVVSLWQRVPRVSLSSKTGIPTGSEQGNHSLETMLERASPLHDVGHKKMRLLYTFGIMFF